MASSAAPISNNVKKIWDTWNLRGFIILSLSLQTFLILFAPLRKRTSSKWVIVPIWLAYLLADWAANFAIGLIASSQTNTEESPHNGGLLTFWAPFLLLHLGGPDTIIAISMEDNALWPRHLLGLIFQVLAAVYVFIMQSSQENKLRWPTLLLFLPGIIKYAERTRALYLASLERLKYTILATPEPGPDYAKYMDEYFSRKTAGLPVLIDTQAGRGSDTKNVTYLGEEGDNDSIAVVKRAYDFYKISMGLLIDLVFDFHEREESRAYFHNRNSEEAFTLIATELNFMYEALYTKVSVVHSLPGYILRVMSFCAVCIACVFFFKVEKDGFEGFDVGVTYSLLFGAISLDSITVSMLIISDSTIAALSKSCQRYWIAPFLMKKYLNLKRSWWCTTTTRTKCLERTRQLLFRRWSESVSAFSFIHYSLQESGRVQPRLTDYFGFLSLKVIKIMGLKDLRDEMKYRSKKTFTKELWEFIFEELKIKSVLADDPEIGKKICSARGEWILKMKYGDMLEDNNLETYVVDVTYDRSILIWHIATELCYHTETSTNEDTYRVFSKTLSDYMLYLLIMQPALMSSVAGIGQKRFSDTMAEANLFFKKRAVGSDSESVEACKKLLEVNTEVKPVDVKGNRSKSVLFDACILARELKDFKGSKWELIAEVWVELLSYAASHCRADSHAQLLSKGGELVTFVWLLMARFGIAEQFQGLEVQARVKLIVGKPAEVYCSES